MRTISVRGASEHNLKHVNLEIPRGALTVFTGISGSGKSSLVFDTIHKEGQRRFIESLSSYARQFLGGFEKPRVDLIEGLSPTISVDQRSAGGHVRSTVGTITEIYDYLRLLYSRVGSAHCPCCGRSVEARTVDQITDQILLDFADQRLLVCAPVVRARRGTHRRKLDELFQSGFQRLRIDGVVHKLRPSGNAEEVEIPALDRRHPHDIDIVFDRVRVENRLRSRLAESVEKCLELADGIVRFVPVSRGDKDSESEDNAVLEPDCLLNANAACPHCRTNFPDLEPRLFSFNSPHGACPRCRGLGDALEFDLPYILGTEDFAVRDLPRQFDEVLPGLGTEIAETLAAALDSLKVDLGASWKDLNDEVCEKILRGSEGDFAGVVSKAETRFFADFEGDEVPASLRACLREARCRVCDGTRLREEARAVTLGDRHLGELSEMTISDLRVFLQTLEFPGNRAQVGEPILREVLARLGYLIEVGLPYLSLGRASPTLSGGERQRVRLAGVVGSRLQGVVFVLDEPSIGLHQRDQTRLVSLLARLRDQGNTLLVVEHDRETIESADHVVDLGPGAGRDGGEIVAEGCLEDLRSCVSSVTADYLVGKAQVGVSKRRRIADGWLELTGATFNNLKNIDVRIPLNVLVAVTGVSGSGKSSLVHGVLVPSLKRSRTSSTARSSALQRLCGAGRVDRVVEVHQGSLSRSPRSNPATYTRIFQTIRELFAATPMARTRGFQVSRFSFNCEDGRCFRCRGAGVEQIEMEFLPAVEVLCNECQGRRYNRETLEISYRGKTIADVLDMTVREAVEFFHDHEEIVIVVKLLEEIGLGYLRLGQPANTLSGGESQRVRLAAELSRPDRGHVLFVLDEPTTGLHFRDIQNLLQALHRLVGQGNTVLVIEHNLDVILDADHVIDMGPEGGDEGGYVVCVGTPEEVAAVDESHTGLALRENESSPETQSSAGGLQNRDFRLQNDIQIHGARQHNLKNIDVRIPQGKLSVVTGVSGSGKSSLAFDTLFAEGQRIYLESLSTYARRFLSRLKNANVERIEGLAPSVAIDQRALASNVHSTVGTVTEIYHYLRLLFARIGHPYCPECGKELVSTEPGRLSDDLVERHAGKRAYVLTPLSTEREERQRFLDDALHGIEALRSKEKLLGRDVLNERPGALDRLTREGFTRLWVDGQEVRLDDPLEDVQRVLSGLRHRSGADGNDELIYLVIDRVVLESDMRSRIAAALERAFTRGAGRATLVPVGEKTETYSRIPTCPTGHYSFPAEISPRLFSFNSQLGACPECQGRGMVLSIQPRLLIRKSARALLDGGLFEMACRLVFSSGSAESVALETFASESGIDLAVPLDQISDDKRRDLLEGIGDWPGVYTLVQVWYRQNHRGLKPSVFKSVSSTESCAVCEGRRLRDEALLVRVASRDIAELSTMTVENLAQFVDGLQLEEREERIARLILGEVRHRLRFLSDVGLRYLTMSRRSDTLSGGEAQRIRLASQIGNRMSGIVYVLDEPTIGLHPRDTGALLHTLKGLLELDNTVVVVEHDRDCILAADHVIDMGPGAGPRGGDVVAQGEPNEIVRVVDSLTAQYLRGDCVVCERSGPRREPLGNLHLRGVRRHNLKNIDVTVPLGNLVAVTGVSGSGKSSLVLDVLAAELKASTNARRPRRGRPRVGDTGELRVPEHCDSIDGDESITRLLLVDQSPIGRSPRSNPATYTKLWEAVRKFYALLPGSRVKGFGQDRFSFNSRAGRCEACKGEGAVLVSMHFMSDVWLPCEKCSGLRFNQETLEVRFRGLNVGDLLRTEVETALELFENHPQVSRVLKVMDEVGLGYLQLGQSSTTLSGGEAQRVKLAAELAHGRLEGALYVLDEPTTGLHFDDVRKLLEVLHRLVDGGATVVVVEHNLDVIAACDYVIDLGPGGGEEGGHLVACGSPEDIVASDASVTGKYLRSGIHPTSVE